MEAFDYYLGIKNFYEWKKNVVKVVDDESKKYEKEPFRVVDFSIYHSFTAGSCSN